MEAVTEAVLGLNSASVSSQCAVQLSAQPRSRSAAAPEALRSFVWKTRLSLTTVCSQALQKFWDRGDMERTTVGLSATWSLLLLLLLLWLGAAVGQRSRERVYYVGIIEDRWDYAPGGNLLNGNGSANDE